MKVYRACCLGEKGLWRTSLNEAKFDLENILSIVIEDNLMQYGDKAYVESVTISNLRLVNELGDDGEMIPIKEYVEKTIENGPNIYHVGVWINKSS